MAYYFEAKNMMDFRACFRIDCRVEFRVGRRYRGIKTLPMEKDDEEKIVTGWAGFL